MDKLNAIEQRIAEFKAEGKSAFATSSFQSHSIPLLHIISRFDKSIPIYYLNTGYLFPETLSFKDQLQDLLGMEFIGLESSIPKSQQRDSSGQLFFTSDPDYCCYLNKTQPLEPILQSKDIWINGIRADQSKTRAAMGEFEDTPQGAKRYHPMLHWTSKEIWEYRKAFDLPNHPLEAKGYLSIGCEPCTRKMSLATDDRSARWFGMNKVECGLHTDLIKKEEA
jgi:phosphoadenosine phosphosulfate reductase